MFHVKHRVRKPPQASDYPSEDEAALFPEAPALSIEKEGERQLDQINEALHKEHWGTNVLALILTAGPITFIGLQAGYYIGYGKFAPTNLFIYFASFTLVAGLLSIGLKIHEHLKKGSWQKKQESDIRESVACLPILIAAARDFHLSTLPEEDRKIDAAGYIIRNSHAEAAALRQAIFWLTDDIDFANLIVERDVANRYGTQNILNPPLASSARQELERAGLGELETRRPDIYHWLLRRVMGRRPTLQEGLPRSEGFIERLLAWTDAGNDEILRGRDLEELFTLAFELLCGREIPQLRFRYFGESKIAEVVERLEKYRNSYRVAMAARFSRLKALARFLEQRNYIEPSENKRNAQEIYEDVCTGIDALCRDIQNLKEVKTARDRRKLLHKQHMLAEIIKLFNELILADKRYRTQQDNYFKAEWRWKAVLRKHGAQQTENADEEPSGTGKLDRPLFDKSFRPKGLTIVERQINLTDHEKALLSQKLAPLLHRHDVKAKGISGHLAHEPVKEIAVEILNILDPLIQIGDADIQRAIELSRAPNYNSIQSGFSAIAKAAWGKGLAGELLNDLQPVAERAYSKLVHQYKFDMSQEDIETFCERYNVSEDRLNAIREHPPVYARMESSFYETLKTRPALKKHWQRTYIQSQFRARAAK